MSRSGYSYDNDCNLWRGAVAQAIKGKRGQAFLRELATAMDAMPVKKLITEELINAQGEVCALGAVVQARGLDPIYVYEDDPGSVGDFVGIARALAAEIAYINDEANYDPETPEQRWTRVREWVKITLDIPLK